MDNRADEPKRRVLLVEDEPGMMRLVTHALLEAGYDVGTARDGEQGLRLFREAKWDAVITDRAMPKMNGEDMAALIKAETPDIPVILITGLQHMIRRAELFQAVLSKPFTRKQLLAQLSGAFVGRRGDSTKGGSAPVVEAP